MQKGKTFLQDFTDNALDCTDYSERIQLNVEFL